MPLYDYECEACQKRFERIQKFSDPQVEVCPNCGKGPVRKLPSSPAIQFKGSGFYITDYAKKSTSEAGSKANSGGESSASGASEAKPSTEGKSSGAKPSDTSSKPEK